MSSPSATDASLAVYTHFKFILEEPQHKETEKAKGDYWLAHYNHVTHKYYDNYVIGADWQLRLDPTPGIQMALVDTPQELERAVEQIKNVLKGAQGVGGVPKHQPGPAGTPGSPLEQRIPDALVRWEWSITRPDGSAVDAKSVERNQKPWGLAVFNLPGPGDYIINCTVVFTGDRAFTRKITLTVQEYYLAGIGDSYASGEGNPDVDGTVEPWDQRCAATTASMGAGSTPSMSHSPQWVEPSAHRSLNSGQARAARGFARLSGQTVGPEQPNISSATLTRVVFTHFARTGATITKGILSAQDGIADYAGCGQVEELRRASRGRKIDALMISIGGNDLGFSDVVTGLVTGDIHDFFSVSGVLKYLYDNLTAGPAIAGMSAISAIAGGSGIDEEARRKIELNLEKLLGVNLEPREESDIEILYESVFASVNHLDQEVGIGEIYITGYPPNPFGVNTANGIEYQYCGVFDNWDASLTSADSRMLERFGLLLNELIKRKASKFGWHYVDVAPLFQGHGYCAGGKEGFYVGAEESCNRQGNFLGTLHPNSRGHRAYQEALTGSMERHTFSRPPL